MKCLDFVMGQGDSTLSQSRNIIDPGLQSIKVINGKREDSYRISFSIFIA